MQTGTERRIRRSRIGRGTGGPHEQGTSRTTKTNETAVLPHEAESGGNAEPERKYAAQIMYHLLDNSNWDEGQGDTGAYPVSRKALAGLLQIPKGNVKKLKSDIDFLEEEGALTKIGGHSVALSEMAWHVVDRGAAGAAGATGAAGGREGDEGSLCLAGDSLAEAKAKFTQFLGGLLPSSLKSNQQQPGQNAGGVAQGILLQPGTANVVTTPAAVPATGPATVATTPAVPAAVPAADPATVATTPAYQSLLIEKTAQSIATQIKEELERRQKGKPPKKFDFVVSADVVDDADRRACHRKLGTDQWYIRNQSNPTANTLVFETKYTKIQFTKEPNQTWDEFFQDPKNWSPMVTSYIMKMLEWYIRNRSTTIANELLFETGYTQIKFTKEPGRTWDEFFQNPKNWFKIFENEEAQLPFKADGMVSKMIRFDKTEENNRSNNDDKCVHPEYFESSETVKSFSSIVTANNQTNQTNKYANLKSYVSPDDEQTMQQVAEIRKDFPWWYIGAGIYRSPENQSVKTEVISLYVTWTSETENKDNVDNFKWIRTQELEKDGTEPKEEVGVNTFYFLVPTNKKGDTWSTEGFFNFLIWENRDQHKKSCKAKDIICYLQQIFSTKVVRLEDGRTSTMLKELAVLVQPLDFVPCIRNLGVITSQRPADENEAKPQISVSQHVSQRLNPIKVFPEKQHAFFMSIPPLQAQSETQSKTQGETHGHSAAVAKNGELPEKHSYKTFAVSPDGKRIAVVLDEGGFMIYQRKRQNDPWSPKVDTNRVTRQMDRCHIQSSDFIYLCFSNDGKYLAFCNAKGQIGIVSITNKKHKQLLSYKKAEKKLTPDDCRKKQKQILVPNQEKIIGFRFVVEDNSINAFVNYYLLVATNGRKIIVFRNRKYRNKKKASQFENIGTIWLNQLVNVVQGENIVKIAFCQEGKNIFLLTTKGALYWTTVIGPEPGFEGTGRDSIFDIPARAKRTLAEEGVQNFCINDEGNRVSILSGKTVVVKSLKSYTDNEYDDSTGEIGTLKDTIHIPDAVTIKEPKKFQMKFLATKSFPVSHYSHLIISYYHMEENNQSNTFGIVRDIEQKEIALDFSNHVPSTNLPKQLQEKDIKDSINIEVQNFQVFPPNVNNYHGFSQIKMVSLKTGNGNGQNTEPQLNFQDINPEFERTQRISKLYRGAVERQIALVKRAVQERWSEKLLKDMKEIQNAAFEFRIYFERNFRFPSIFVENNSDTKFEPTEKTKFEPINTSSASMLEGQRVLDDFMRCMETFISVTVPDTCNTKTDEKYFRARLTHLLTGNFPTSSSSSSSSSSGVHIDELFKNWTGAILKMVKLIFSPEIFNKSVQDKQRVVAGMIRLRMLLKDQLFRMLVKQYSEKGGVQKSKIEQWFALMCSKIEFFTLKYQHAQNNDDTWADVSGWEKSLKEENMVMHLRKKTETELKELQTKEKKLEYLHTWILLLQSILTFSEAGDVDIDQSLTEVDELKAFHIMSSERLEELFHSVPIQTRNVLQPFLDEQLKKKKEEEQLKQIKTATQESSVQQKIQHKPKEYPFDWPRELKQLLLVELGEGLSPEKWTEQLKMFQEEAEELQIKLRDQLRGWHENPKTRMVLFGTALKFVQHLGEMKNVQDTAYSDNLAEEATHIEELKCNPTEQEPKISPPYFLNVESVDLLKEFKDDVKTAYYEETEAYRRTKKDRTIFDTMWETDFETLQQNLALLTSGKQQDVMNAGLPNVFTPKYVLLTKNAVGEDTTVGEKFFRNLERFIRINLPRINLPDQTQEQKMIISVPTEIGEEKTKNRSVDPSTFEFDLTPEEEEDTEEEIVIG